VGDAQRLGKKGPVLRVAVADRESALVLRSDDGNWVWAFNLVHEVAGTRLLSRSRIATPGASWPSRVFYRYVMEPGSLVMECWMLLGIKERAERLARGSDVQATPLCGTRSPSGFEHSGWVHESRFHALHPWFAPM
jgi:hypothetical protein